VIKINAIVNWLDVDGSAAERSVIRRLDISVRDPRRSADFYMRAFGFYRLPSQREPRSRSILMTAGAGIALALHEQRGARSPAAPALRRWAFVVADIDHARGAVWELGVRIARGSTQPDQVYRRLCDCSLYVLDPDANEIELVESESEAQSNVEALTGLRIPLSELEVLVQ
jgi:catechol 2,3-dioxygenase-like lactoylglutathione lyase family enzyme